MRWRSTGGWTSARPNCLRPSGRGCSTTCSTSSTSPRPPRSLRTSAWPARRSRACEPPAAPPSWSVGPGCTCRPCWTSWTSRGRIPHCGPSWTAELAAVGPHALHNRLAAVDPAAAAAVLPSNGRRIVRALEVVMVTGRPFSARLAVDGSPRYDAVLLGVDRPTPELDARVARRVALMFAAGLVDETRGLLDRGLRRGQDSLASVGLPAGRHRTRRHRGPVGRGRRHGACDASVHPPAALLVPPRPANHMAGGRARARRPGPRPAVRRLGAVSAGVPFAKGHGTGNDFVLCPTRTTCSTSPPPGSPRCATDAGDSVPTACCGWCAGRRWRPTRSRPAGRRVVHGLPQRGRLGGGDVRQRRARLRPLPGAPALPMARTRRCVSGPAPACVEVGVAATVAVDMGPARAGPDRPPGVAGATFAGPAVDLGNPHLAWVTDDAAGGARPRGGDRATTARCSPRRQRRVRLRGARRHVTMRVHERGMGETRCAARGTVAAVVATLRARGRATGDIEVRTSGGSTGGTVSRPIGRAARTGRAGRVR